LGVSKSDGIAHVSMQSNANVTPKSTAPPPDHPIAPPPKRNRASKRIAATYDYTDATGTLLFQVVRYEPKDFRQRRPNGSGWSWNLKGIERVLYRLPGLVSADPSETVFLVEGERDADNLAALGLVSTTNSGGAGKWRDSYADALKGRSVAILPDADQPGRQHAEQVAKSLHGVAKSVKVVSLPNLPPKGDVSDWVSQGGTTDDMLRLVDAADEWVPVEDDASGRPSPRSQPFRTFPLDALPRPLAFVVQNIATSVGCDPSVCALPLLSAIGACVGNSRRIEIKSGWREPPGLWVAIVAESGQGKTPAIKPILKPIRDRQGEAIKQHAADKAKFDIAMEAYERELAAHRKSGKGDRPKQPVEPTAERCIVSDTTIEGLCSVLSENPRGLLSFNDELAAFFGGIDRYAARAGGDLPHWLTMYDAETLLVDRKTGDKRTIHVKRAFVSLAGGIQPAMLCKSMTEERLASGLMSRFVFTMPPPFACGWIDRGEDSRVGEILSTMYGRLFDLPMQVAENGDPYPRTIHLSPDGLQTIKEFIDRHGEEQSTMTGHMASAWAKFRGRVARVALILHCAKHALMTETSNHDVVGGGTVADAVRICEWLKHEAARVYDQMFESASDGEDRQIVAWIDRRGGTATARELVRAFRSIQDTVMAEAILGRLVTGCFGKWQDSAAGPKGGRPTRRFKLLRGFVDTVDTTPTSTHAGGFGYVDTPEVAKTTQDSSIIASFDTIPCDTGGSNSESLGVDVTETPKPPDTSRGGAAADTPLADPSGNGGDIPPSDNTPSPSESVARVELPPSLLDDGPSGNRNYIERM